MARVPLNDLSRARDLDELSEIASEVINSGNYIFGPQHDAFEREFAAYLNARYAIGVASGSDALELALRGVGCKPGWTVLISPYTCYAETAVASIGAKAGETDVDCVLATHLYGKIDRIVEKAWDIPLVEDCAHATGARLNGKMAGTFGDAAAFSFYPTKPLAALGDGGAVVTNNHEVADRVTALRQYGWDKKYEITYNGGRNSRLDELQAAFLRSRLDRVDARNAQRREIVQFYREALPVSVGSMAGVNDDSDAAHLAVVFAKDRERLVAHLDEGGISTAIHYPPSDEVLTIPCFPEMTVFEVERVCEALSCG